MVVMELSSPVPHPTWKMGVKTLPNPIGITWLKYVIAENNAWHLGSVPKELVMTITHSPDLSSNNTFLGKPSLTPSGQSGPHPAKHSAQHMLPPPMHFCSELQEYPGLQVIYWLDLALSFWTVWYKRHGKPATSLICSLRVSPLLGQWRDAVFQGLLMLNSCWHQITANVCAAFPCRQRTVIFSVSKMSLWNSTVVTSILDIEEDFFGTQSA